MYVAELWHISPWFNHVKKTKCFKYLWLAYLWVRWAAWVDDFFLPSANGWEEIGIEWKIKKLKEGYKP